MQPVINKHINKTKTKITVSDGLLAAAAAIPYPCCLCVCVSLPMGNVLELLGSSMMSWNQNAEQIEMLWSSGGLCGAVCHMV